MKQLIWAAAAVGAMLVGVPALAQSDVKAGVEAWQRGDYRAAVAQWREIGRAHV